jgi:hypothetical protein
VSADIGVEQSYRIALEAQRIAEGEMQKAMKRALAVLSPE